MIEWNMAFPLYFIAHSPRTRTTRCIQNLNGLSIVFYRSQSVYTWWPDVYKTWMACPSYFIIHSPRTCDDPTYTKLEWLVHRILSFTVCAHVTTRRIQNLNGLSIVFYRSQSVYTWWPNVYKTWMACPLYFIVHSQRTRNDPTYTRLLTSAGLAQARPI